jgi:Do/DeqQ family serine protease
MISLTKKGLLGILVAVSLTSSLFSFLLFQNFSNSSPIVIREKVSPLLPYEIQEQVRSANTSSNLSPPTFSLAAEKALSAVVSIAVLRKTEDFWSKIHGRKSIGSGVVLTRDGLIVTNHHVIENHAHIEVSLEDARIYKALIVGSDPATDIALLKIDAEDLPTLSFGDSDQLKIGEWVIAVGNPFQLSSTVTAGIVSAKARNINILNQAFAIESFIQTDAVVNPGNSGGALVNQKGELVGINTAIVTESGRFEGYSFAIPSNLVLKVIQDLKEYGQVQRGLLGITLQDLNWDLAKKLGYNKAKGVVIDRVNARSAASDAGLKRGDILQAVNGIEIVNFPMLQEKLGLYRPGDSLQVKYFREGNSFLTTIILKNQYNTTQLLTVRSDPALLALGFELRNLTEEEIQKISTSGVYVASIYRNSALERANMDPGFVIEKLNGKSVNSVDDVLSEIANANQKIIFQGRYLNYKGSYIYEINQSN